MYNNYWVTFPPPNPTSNFRYLLLFTGVIGSLISTTVDCTTSSTRSLMLRDSKPSADERLDLWENNACPRKLSFTRRWFFSFPEIRRQNFTWIWAMEISFLVPFIIAFGLPYFAKISVICLLRLCSSQALYRLGWRFPWLQSVWKEYVL